MQYRTEPPWLRGSVVALRPPGLESRILCLEDSVFLFAYLLNYVYTGCINISKAAIFIMCRDVSNNTNIIT